MKNRAFTDLNDLSKRGGFRKGFIADQLGISTFRMSALLHPGRYYVAIDDALVHKIAQLLNQSEDYVRELYGLRAA